MEKLVIEGGKSLAGEVTISGAKNSSLPLMAATLLAEGKSRLHNLPKLRDVETIKYLLLHLGVEISENNGNFNIDTAKLTSSKAPYDLVKTMRASVLVLGPLLARFKNAMVSLPGGCAIGARPIDLHLMGLEKLGAEIEVSHGYVKATAKELKGANIYFDIPTVTGTENLMMAASLAKGKTILENAAKEPEIVELAKALNIMGAKIKGAGSNIIYIDGVKALKPLDYYSYS